MIVRMSKISIIGSKDLLMEVLHEVHEIGALQLESDIKSIGNEGLDLYLKSHTLDEQTLSERLFCEDLKEKIDSLLEYIPDVPSREPYLNPRKASESIAEVVPGHIDACRELTGKKEHLQGEFKELQRYAGLVKALEALLPEEGISPDSDYIGIEITRPEGIADLEQFIDQQTRGYFELLTSQTEENQTVGLITTKKEFAEQLRARLHDRQISEFSPGAELEGLSLSAQKQAITQLLADRRQEIAAIDEKLHSFSHRWLGIYRMVRKWLMEQLAVIQATASIYETDLCFVICGWLPKDDFVKVQERINERFGGKVVVEEKEILDHDLERIPTVLKNPAYFQPFEIFARLLPVPAYSSFDITPFIGIFFPVFFGMMLGDIGYGIVIWAVALPLLIVGREKKIVADVAKILGVCGGYTIFFGFLFGEFFGTVGSEFLGLEPIFFDRYAAILPMFYFALAVGVVHIVIGLLVGAISALKRRLRKEALFKLFSVLLILCLAFFGISFGVPHFSLLQRPLLITLAIIIPVLIVTGGLLAPLEVIKSVGNIISYARIMAIGLTSVLLAHVANHLAGMVGSIWIGVFVAVLLHAFNILLGIFAPTIHSLRLHYVEFFSKFMESGGKEFKPLGKE